MIYNFYQAFVCSTMPKRSRTESFSNSSKKSLPLHMAIINSEHDKCIDILNKNGPKINTKDSNGNTALHLAIIHNAPIDIITLLITKNAKFDISNNEGNIPINLVIFHNRVEILKLFITQKVNLIGVVDTERPLIYTICLGRLECSKLLIDSYTINELNLVSINGRTALTQAIKSKNDYLVDLIIDKGKDNVINMRDSWHEPIFYAIFRRNIHAVAKIISSFEDVNRQDITGNTALHDSVLSGNLHFVEIAMAYGININIKNTEGKTALDIAKDKNNQEMINRLENEFIPK
jgi:hypothetical protein